MKRARTGSMTSQLHHALPAALALLLAFAPTQIGAQDGGRAGPQEHVAEFGAYTLRANAIPSDVLPASTARRHGIERAPDRGVLNVLILERRGDGRQVTVRATVTARKENLLDQGEAVAMRPVAENGRVSYLGTFAFAPLRNFRFSISALPSGADQPLTIEFEDRFVLRGR